MVESVVMLNPSVLKVHPRNEEFFDSIEGEDFNRLVESIKLHGVLTPLRATKDMTLISGHQRKRAAIEAGLTEVPVIIDDSTDEDEVLAKLIETNFGRMKNDPIKQAKWLEEYMRLRGVQVGAGRPKNSEKFSKFSIDDVAKELGITAKTLRNLRSLLTLDPNIQQLISDGAISSSTGYNIIVRLSPEEQRKLIDKLSDDVKLTAPTVKAKIEEMRQELVGNAESIRQKNDELLGKVDKLTRENNELLSGNLPANESAQKRITDLEREVRELYEKYEAKKTFTENMQKQLDKAIQAKDMAEAKATGGDEYTIKLESEIDTLNKELKAIERERNDLEFELNEKNEEIERLKSGKDDGYWRSAVTEEQKEEFNERALVHFKALFAQTLTNFQSSTVNLLKNVNMLSLLSDAELSALFDLTDIAWKAAKSLLNAINDKRGVDKLNSNLINNDAPDEIWTEEDMIATGSNNVA